FVESSAKKEDVFSGKPSTKLFREPFLSYARVADYVDGPSLHHQCPLEFALQFFKLGFTANEDVERVYRPHCRERLYLFEPTYTAGSFGFRLPQTRAGLLDHFRAALAVAGELCDSRGDRDSYLLSAVVQFHLLIDVFNYLFGYLISPLSIRL